MLSPSRSSSSIAAGASKQHKKWHLDDDAYSKYIAHSITQYCDWMLPCNMAVCIHWCYVLYSVHSRWWRRVPSTASSSCIRSKSQNYYIPIGFTILMGKCSFRLFELVAYISWVYNNTISNQKAHDERWHRRFLFVMFISITPRTGYHQCWLCHHAVYDEDDDIVKTTAADAAVVHPIISLHVSVTSTQTDHHHHRHITVCCITWTLYGI